MRDQLNKGKYLFTPLKTKRKSFFQGGETKSMKMRKFTASLLAFAMLLTLVAIPVGNADAAGTTYSAVSVPQVSKDDAVQTGVLKVEFDPILSGADSKALIKFNNVDAVTAGPITTGGSVSVAAAPSFADSKTELELTVTASAAGKGELYIPFTINTKNSNNGDITATVTPLSGQFNAGSVVLATVGSGSSTITVDKVKNISGSNNVVTIRVSENRAGALAGKADGLRFELKGDGFKINAATPRALVGDAVIGGVSGLATKEVKFVTTAGSIKSIYDIDLNIDVNDREAKHGDVVIKVRGENTFDVSEIVVAKYADFGTKVDVKDATKIVAGQVDKKIGKIVIEENATASLVDGRTIYLTLPQGARWRTDSSNFGGTISGNNGLVLGVATSAAALNHDATAANDKNRTLKLTVNSPSTGNADKITIDGFKVDTAVGFTGPIEVEISGNAGVAGKVVVAEVTSPIKVTVEKADLKVGVQKQALGKITIEEQVAGALKKGANLEFKFDNVYAGTFTGAGKAAVTNDDDLDVGLSTPSNVLTVNIKKDSYKPGKIEITGSTVTLDRSVPEGDLLVNIAGAAVQEVPEVAFTGALNRVAQTAIATVVTPAPDNGNVVAESKFVIDAKSYTVGGVEKVMDVAPFIQDGRTMLPVRFVAEALGVSEDNIIWNAVTKQVTIMKGDRIAQMTIGSNVVVVNGVSVAMDTVAAVKDGRTVLPVRFVAQALGANIAWDEATRTVTVN